MEFLHVGRMSFCRNKKCVSLQVIAAEGEQKASKSLREASEIIAQSPSALQLRYLQVRIHLIIIARSHMEKVYGAEAKIRWPRPVSWQMRKQQQQPGNREATGRAELSV